MFDLSPYQDQIAQICRKHGVRKLDVFGSATADEFGPESDVDVVVVFEGEEHLFNRFFRLESDLHELFQRPIDLMTDRSIQNPYLRQGVEATRRNVYAA